MTVPIDLGLGPRPYLVALAVLLVVGAFALRRGRRVVLVTAVVVTWAAVLVVAGVTDPAVLAAQVGGGALVGAAAIRTAAALENATEVERAASRATSERTAVVETVLRLHTLEPDAVLGYVAEGACAVGFSSAIVRVPTPEGLRLVAARPAPAEAPPEVLPLGAGVVGRAQREQRTQVIDDHTVDPDASVVLPSLRGAIAAPVTVDGTVVAVLLARREATGVPHEQVRAVEQLTAGAGSALARARRYAAQAAAVDELRRLDAQARDLVSTVSHELRTPLTVVVGLSTTLDDRWDDLSVDRRADLLRRVASNAARLQGMVRSLLDTSAFERGHLEVVVGDVVVAEVVDDVLGRLAPLFADHAVTVAVPSDLAVRGDADLLTHVVENLLVNAARHTPPGTHVSVSACSVDDGVGVEVADDGPGIAAADLPHVRERFYRAGRPSTRARGGLGLGLALAQQVLVAHGSELVVGSVVGEGARFSFRLAAARRDRG